jgi:hypothetical protein
MAKRNNGPTQRTPATATSASEVTRVEAMEQRVEAFAEQLGRMVGTIQVKAEGWMDREKLNKQLASVRDGAAHLLQQLARGAAAAKEKKAAPARKGPKGRSGGTVDAPGKKRRKPAPPDPDATSARSQAGKMRTAMPMAKTNRLRGRG